MAGEREITDRDCRDLYERLLCGGDIHVEKKVPPRFDGSFMGAIALPKGFAENSATVIATAGLHRSLLLLEEEHWGAIATEFLNLTKTGVQPAYSAAAALRSLILGNAVELGISAHRTVELPNHLLEYAGIDKDLSQSWHGQAIELLPAGDRKFL